MSRISNLVREKIEKNEWCFDFDKRKLILELCEMCDVFEKVADIKESIPKTRYDKFKKMNVDELAEAIVKDEAYYGDDYCKCDCGSDDDCPHPALCCKRWLLEEVEQEEKDGECK